MPTRIVTCALLAALAGTPALAQTPPPPIPPISVENAWARASPGAVSTGAAYVTIVDHGAPDRLIGVTSPVAGTVGLHETVRDGDVMRMRPVDGLPVTQAAPLVFAPGGYHVMLEHLHAPLAAGQSFPLTLRFQNAGLVETMVTVRSIGAAATAGAMAMPMGHAGMAKP